MRVLRIMVRCLLWTALCVVALATSAVYHLQLSFARQIARDLTNRFVTGEIRGELVIGRFDQLTTEHVVARHVSLYDGEGRRIIVADRVELTPDLDQLRKGIVRIRVGRILGGTVRLVDNGQGEPSLFTTFDARHPSSGGAKSEPLHLLVDRLELVDLTLYGQMIQLRGVRAEHIHAAGRLEVSHNVEVQIARARGTVVRPFDLVGAIDQLTGSISSDPVIGVKLDVVARRNDEDARAHIAYRSAAPLLPQELDIDIFSSHLTPDTLRRLDFGFAKPLGPPLRGRVHLAGLPEQLALEAQVESQAGNADISGIISSTQGVSVHMQSQSVALDKLVPDAPVVTVRGLLHIVVTDESPNPQVHAEVASLRYRDLVVPAFELDGELVGDGVRIERARATRGGQIALHGYVGFDGSSDLRVDARFPMVQRDPNLSRYAKNLDGTLLAALHIRTRASKLPAQLDVTGRVELRDARYGYLHAAQLVLSGSAHGDPELPELDLQVQGEGFEILSYSLGSARFSLRGGPHTYAAQGGFEAKGQKTFDFVAAVVADRQGYVIQADPIEFSVGTESWRGLIHDLVVINEHSIELGLLRLASRAQRLEAKGILRVKGEDNLQAQLQNFDLAAVFALLGTRFPLSHGYADASMELHGDAERPVLSMQGAVREAKFPEYEAVDVLYTIDYQNGQLQLDTELDLNGHGTLHVSGQGELDAAAADPREALMGGIYNLAVTSTDVDLTLIPGLKDTIESGQLQGSVEAQGGLESITLSGNLAAKRVTIKGWAPIEVTAGFQYDHDALASSVSAKDAGGALANADVNWQIDWQGLQHDPRGTLRNLLANDFHVQGQTLDRALDSLPFNLSRLPLRVESTFELRRTDGQLDGTLNGLVRAKEPLVDETCQLTMGTTLRTTWRLTAGHARVTFEGQLDGREVASGEGGVDWPFDAYLRGAQIGDAPRADLQGQVDIDKIERVPGLCQHGRGELHAHWDLRSLFSHNPSAEFTLRAAVTPEVKVRAGDIDQVVTACKKDPLRIDFTAQADARQITWRGGTLGCSGGSSTLRGLTPVLWDETHRLPAIDDSRELIAELDLRAAQLQPVLDYMPGVLGFSATASGRLSARSQRGVVRYLGQLNVSDGKLYALATGQDLSDIALTLTANGNWMKLDRLYARTGRGSLEATGGLGFDRWAARRVQLALLLKDFPVEQEGMELAALTGSAAVVGEIESAHTRAAVKIHSLSIRLPDASSRTLQSLDPHPDVALVTDQPARAGEAAYTFEFAIEGQQRITARRNDFEASLAVELAIEYRDPELRVGGYVEFRRGTFDVFGKRFEVNRGSMRFDASPELDPEINMVATHQPDTVGASPVFVNVSGTLSAPQVEFYSDQCPGEGAVVLLVSGRCPTESSSGYGDTRGTQDAFAAGIIGGILTLGARRELGGLIPRLAVESSARGTRTRVKAGFEAVPKFMRSLVQRVYVQGALSTADSTAVEASTQSVTTPDFLIELYFPNSIVGAARVAPTVRSWGLDITWEP
jgi:translocation and assembly module TamB